jgi:hypothetical protein
VNVVVASSSSRIEDEKDGNDDDCNEYKVDDDSEVFVVNGIY